MSIATESLTWVIVDGELHHVSAFAALPPRSRPDARCPECDRPLTLKLGAILRHHAAHEPGDACAATHPETALHLDAKFSLAAALRMEAGPAATLTIRERCAGHGVVACGERRDTIWLRAWDRVDVERRVGARRPDIVLLHNGNEIGAIEVVVSNAVSVAKAEVLAELELRWVEVGADVRRIDPLPVIRTSEGVWRCARHAATEVRGARVVDVYHAGGARDRYIYQVTRAPEQHGVTGEPEMQLRRGNHIIASAPLHDRASLRAAFEAELRRLTERDGAFTDSPMRWASAGTAADMVSEALLDRVGRDPTPLATRYPRRWFYSKENSRWFLPDDMRGVRWDRDEIDVFAPHPAWSRARASVRERAAPEGSWSTPVFAARPIAAMFDPASIIRVEGDGNGLAVLEARRRAIVVVERAVSNEAAVVLAAALAREEIDAVWLSSPLDWCDAFASLVWAPAGRDQRGRGGVVIDGVGWFRADQFARALIKGDRRLEPHAIRRSMAGRIERLCDARTNHPRTG